MITFDVHLLDALLSFVITVTFEPAVWIELPTVYTVPADVAMVFVACVHVLVADPDVTEAVLDAVIAADPDDAVNDNKALEDAPATATKLLDAYARVPATASTRTMALLLAVVKMPVLVATFWIAYVPTL